LDAGGHGRGQRGAGKRAPFAAQEVSALARCGLNERGNLFSAARKSIRGLLAGLLIAGSFTAFAHAYWTDWAATHSIVPTVAIVAGVIGVVWLYEELRGLWRRHK
jgi:hypothetical protein